MAITPQRDLTVRPGRLPVAKPLRADVEVKTLPPLPQVAGGWSTILADPPWRFTNRTGKVAPEHRRLDRYDTMTAKEVCALPVAEIAAERAHLYLWVPNALLPDGLAVMESWGFRYVSNIIWAKRRKDGGPDGRGVGFYFRNVTEIILFGVRGSLRTLPPGRRQVNIIETRKREHSRKPDETYEIIESCSPGPYLELFARYPHPGWSVWGDEAAENIVPRGKIHPSYRGGSFSAPALSPHQRLDEETQQAIGKALRIEYEKGASISELAAQTGYTVARTRNLLVIAGTIFRERGKRSLGVRWLS